MTGLSEPDVAAPLGEAEDPFGLWQPVDLREPGAESFSVPGDGEAPARAGGLAWSLDLRSDVDGSVDAGEQLMQRERQVQAIEEGLGQAVIRAERTLARHRAAAQGQAVSFSVDEPEAELDLALALAQIDPGERPASFDVSFGVLPAVDWGELKRRFDAFMEGINRQVLHYAWVETKLDGAAVAQTSVRWGGDLNTFLLPGLGPQIAAAHTQSMTLALASRAANLRAAITVMQIAAKIALVVSTPIGVVQALSLAWQFVHDVIAPLLEGARRQP